MTAKEFINKKYPTLVTNWSHQASLLSYDQVAALMEDFYIEITKTNEMSAKEYREYTNEQ